MPGTGAPRHACQGAPRHAYQGAPRHARDRAARLARFGSALLLACGSGNDRASAPAGEAIEHSVPLAQAEDWTLADAAADPFVRFEAGRLRCSSAAVQPEGTWIEVSTLDCNYATLAYTFSAPAPAASVLRGEIAWSTLAAVDPALATLSFALTEHELWSHEVPIPGTANLVSVEFSLPRAAATGAALYFHVRNHGYNSWQLSPLTLEPAPPSNGSR